MKLAAMPSLVALALLCAGMVRDPREGMPTRLEMAQQVAQHPFVEGAPEFLTSYDPEHFGERSSAMSWTDNATGVRMHPVSLKGDFSFGGVTFESVVLGFGYLDKNRDVLLEEPLGTEHVLKSMTVWLGPATCATLRAWLDETYGEGPHGGRYDGITHAIKFAWFSRDRERSQCKVWWSYLMPYRSTMFTFYDGSRLPDGSAHQTAEPYRLEYNRTWLRTAQRILRGESLVDVEPAILAADLDETHRQELRRRLILLPLETR